MADFQLPYFDFLLGELEKNNAGVEASFGRHVHWGYWKEPDKALYTDADYARAAEQLTLELCEIAGIADGQSLLDAGCGFGGTTASINERFHDMKITGLNIDPRQLERARKIVKATNGNTIAFVEGDACALPFADASFDRVLAVECIFHFPSRAKFFAEAHRVLKPGGTLTLSDFVPSTLNAPFNILLAKLGVTHIGAIGAWRMDHTLARYRRLAASTGFEVVTERDATMNTLPTYRYIQELLRRGGRKRDSMFSHICALARFMGRTGMTQYRLLSYRKA